MKSSDVRFCGRRLIRWAAAAAMLAGGVEVSGGEVFLVRDGTPQAEIVIAPNPLRMVKLAAEELQTYVEKISGARLPITNAPSQEVPVQIYVGKSAQTDKLHLTDEGLKNGAFRMESSKNTLVLLGHDSDFTPPEPFHPGGKLTYSDPAMVAWDKRTGEKWGFPLGNLFKEHSNLMKIWDLDERGSLNAVYEFLRMQGVRWYLPDPLGEIVPQKRSIALPEISKTVRPDFPLRFPYQYGREFGHEGATRDEVLWRLRLGENRGWDLIGEPGSGLAHGMNPLYSRDEVKKAHPEYYFLAGGKRDTETFGAGRPCLSSEGLFQQNVKYARTMFDIYNVPLISVMPQDGYATLCQCDLCKGKDTPERGWDGAISDYVWDYVNRVAKEVYKTHPNKKIGCYAYGAYLLTPTNIAALSPNVLVGICQNRCMFADPKERQKFTDLRKAWLAKMPAGSRQLIINDYYLNSAPRNIPHLPFYYPHTIARDLRDLKGLSIGEFIEQYRGPGIASLAVDHLNLYVTARFWWDASQDVDALLDEYYTLFYGPARQEMKAFIEYSEANLFGLDKSAAKIDQVFALLDKARGKAPADSVYAKRIAWVAAAIRPLKDIREQLAKGRGDVPEAVGFERSKDDIKLDGKLDDKFWDKLWVYGLSDLETGKAPYMDTSFRIGWADGAVYFGISCADRDTKTLNIGATKNEDGNLFNGDCVEILLETQSHSYYQFAINPAGAFADLDRKTGINSLWSSQAEVASYVTNGFWSLEIRIPVVGEQQEAIDPLNGVSGRRPSATYPWYFNVCRQRVRENGKETSAFSPTGKASFHEVIKFGKLYVR